MIHDILLVLAVETAILVNTIPEVVDLRWGSLTVDLTNRFYIVLHLGLTLESVVQLNIDIGVVLGSGEIQSLSARHEVFTVYLSVSIDKLRLHISVIIVIVPLRTPYSLKAHRLLSPFESTLSWLLFLILNDLLLVEINGASR